jgi:hypothetical protein
MSERLFVRLHEDATQGPESEAPAGTLRTLAFDASLSPHVTHALAYREDIQPGHDVIERVLPDGALRLVFNFGASVSGDRSPSALLIGAHGLGIGKGLLDATRTHLGSNVALILSSVPDAVAFYERAQMERVADAFWYRRGR